MEVVEYVETRNRMCDSFRDCKKCPLSEVDCDCHGEKDPYEIVDVVEMWARENPVVKNRDKFKEVFGFEPTNAMFYGWLDEEYDPKQRG